MNSNMVNGIEGSHFFYAVVENRHDPMMLGRVQVRIMGLHSELKQGNDKTGQGITTEDLPWAYPVQNITNAAMNGIGQSPTGIVEGTHVVGISRDGRMMNDLIILGTLGGIPKEKPNGQIGFNDPNAIYPREDFVGEPDTNRLARNEDTENTIQNVDLKGAIDKKVSHANDTGEWDEPKSPYAAVYPYNHVTESESGHIIEVDDTEGAERLHTYHKSGTFEEIHPDGTVVTRIVGDEFEITIKDRNVHVKGSMNITVDGDASIYVKGNVEEQVAKNVNRVIEGNVVELIKGTLTRTVTGNVTETFESNKTIDISGTDSETVGGSQTNTIAGGITTDGGPTIKMTAGRVDIN